MVDYIKCTQQKHTNPAPSRSSRQTNPVYDEMVDRPDQPRDYILCYRQLYKQLHRYAVFYSEDALRISSRGTAWLLWSPYLSTK